MDTTKIGQEDVCQPKKTSTTVSDHKEYFSGEQALKAGGKDNTMNQFG